MVHLPIKGVLRERPFTREGNYLVSDFEASNDAPQIIGHVIEVVNNEAQPAAMAAEAPLVMEGENEASSASSTDSSRARRRERRKKKKKKLQEKYVAPPGDEKVGLKWANELPEIVLLQVSTS